MQAHYSPFIKSADLDWNQIDAAAARRFDAITKTNRRNAINAAIRSNVYQPSMFARVARWLNQPVF